MIDDDVMLERFRIAAATGDLAGDLAAWALELVEVAVDDARESARKARDREARNDRLRRAAALVGGSRWAQAHALEAAIAGESDVAGVAELVAEALRLDPDCPRSWRHLMRLLAA